MFSREQSACTVIFFSEKAPLSSVSLFEGGGQPSASHGSRPTVAEAWRGLNSWARRRSWLMSKRGGFPSRARRPRTRVSGWMMMMQFR